MAANSIKTVRCAIYTRKSTEHGLELEFNSLDAQREACEAYIKSQASQGWRALPQHYDDPAFSGGNLDRPALQQLLRDIDAGRVDVIVVYKIDRLTRSLADFAKLVEAFDAKSISFVAVTQQFNTTTSMGRLTLNVLLSFAQFERELSSERVRDKVAASRRKGKWTGGSVPLAELIGRTGNNRLEDEIEILSTLIEQYEENNFPIEVPDPISAIKFRMEEAGLTPRQIEPYIGSRARVSEVLSGKRMLSLEMIRSLHFGLQIPYEALLSDRGRSSNKGSSYSAPKLSDAIDFDSSQGSIPSASVSSVHFSNALLRKTRTVRAAAKTDLNAILQWQSALIKKVEPPKNTFRRKDFGYEQIRQLARMSIRQDGPKRALKKLSDLGVCVAVLPALPGTFLDGAAMIGPSGSPIIGLTLRHDRIDNFWFTLLHECAHVSLHLTERSELFIDDLEVQSVNQQEEQADKLARDALIPPIVFEQVNWDKSSTYDDLISVAARARIHPTVAIRRWQRDHQNYKRFSRMIDRASIREILNSPAER